MGSSACTGLFFFPSKQDFHHPGDWGIDYESVSITVDEKVRLQAWLLQAKDARTTVLHLHGNAQNMSAHVASVAWLAKNGFRVMTYDYRGYGRSEGLPEVGNSIADFHKVLAAVLVRFPPPEHRLVVYGQSLGGAIAVNGLARSALSSCVGALIVEGSFSNYRMIARDKLARFWLTRPLREPLSLAFASPLNPDQVIDKLEQPVLIIHATDDPVVPFYHGQRLYRLAAKPKAFWPLTQTGHIQFTRLPENRRKLLRFMRTATAEPAPCSHPGSPNGRIKTRE